jgi:glycerol uptake facilitator protein
MNNFIAELIGTAILVVLGNGVVANVVLQKTKGNGGGWIVITFGWGMAVFVGVFCVKGFSGAHLNPAVTIALAAHRGITWQQVPTFIGGQLVGGLIGALVVFLFYREHFAATDDANAKLACFCTSPAIRNLVNAFFCEMIGTFLLVFPIFLMTDPSFALDMGAPTKHHGMLGLGAIGALPVGLLVFAIGLSLGGTTGYAINPARDFAPRLVHALLPIRNKRDSDWSYAWIPIVAPIVGGLLAAAAANAIGLPTG